MKSRTAFSWAAVGLILLSFALRLHWLGRWELGFDEVASFFIARRPPLEMLTYLRGAIREHPPLYYLLLSGWMHLAGNSEFALRLPSALIGAATVALFFRYATAWMGHRVGLVAGLLLAVSPSHIWASQTARMYSLVVLCSLLSLHFFWRLLQGSDRASWSAFVLSTAAGLCTHYYFAFIVVVENLFLIAGGRRYRRLWAGWAAIHGTALLLLVVWATGAGPGATLLSILQHGPSSNLRWQGLVRVINEVMFGPYRHLNWWALSAVGLPALTGLVLVGRRRLWQGLGRAGSLLVGLLLFLPLVFLLALPVLMEGRYVIGIVLPLFLAIAATVAWLQDRCWPLALLALTAVLLPTVSALPELYSDRFGTYRARVETIRQEARPGDPLILNGPWQALLLTYYSPGDVHLVLIPHNAPPGIDPARAEATLQNVWTHSPRAWVSYDSLNATDPDRFVARWLYAHSYQVWAQSGLTLYYRQPPDEAWQPARPTDVSFGNTLRLRRADIAGLQVAPGDGVLVTLEWESLQEVNGTVQMQLDLVGDDDWVWSSNAFHPAPFDCPAAPWPAGEERTERRGVAVPIGTPPGHYTIILKVLGPDGTTLPSPEGEELEVASIEVIPSTTAQEAAWVQAVQPVAVFDQGLELLRCEPGGERFSPGHPVPFKCYWRAGGALQETYHLLLQFISSNGTVAQEEEVTLSPTYPPPNWPLGLIVADHYGPQVSPLLPGGRYRLRLLVADEDNTPIGPASDLFPFVIEWPRASHHMPPSARRIEATMGATIHLRGYDLTRDGTQLRLTLYWQADERPQDSYLVFVHVGLADTSPVAQTDGVPGEWLRPTNTWRPREIVADVHEISLDDVEPGQYGIYIGLYDGSTGQRLTTVVDGVATPDGRVLLETIEVPR